VVTDVQLRHNFLTLFRWGAFELLVVTHLQ